MTVSRDVSVDYLVVHCSATPPEMDIGVEEIRRWHMRTGGENVGYHYIIRRDGSIEKGRTDGTPGAHARLCCIVQQLYP